MAKTPTGLSKAIEDPKKRALLVFFGIIIILILIFILGSSSSSNKVDPNATKGVAQAMGTPDNLRALPGFSKDPNYVKLEQQANTNRVAKASQTGSSAFPSLTSPQGQSETSMAAAEAMQEQAQKNTSVRQQQAQQNAKMILQSSQDNVQRLQQAQLDRQKEIEYENQRKSYEGLIEQQASALIKSWSSPKQSFFGEAVSLPPLPSAVRMELGQPGNNPIGGENQFNGPPSGIPLRAGDIVFAVTINALDSDYPGPVYAEVINGKLKGGRVFGSLQRKNDKLVLSFKSIVFPDMTKSARFSGLAIDLDSAYSAVASDVDHHYLLRYGTFLASSFLAGMGQAVQSSISSPSLQWACTSSGNCVLSSGSANVTGKNLVLSGLGQVGQRIGENINQFDRAVTVKLDAGTPIGILIDQDENIALSDADLNSANTATFSSANPLQNATAANNNASAGGAAENNESNGSGGFKPVQPIDHQATTSGSTNQQAGSSGMSQSPVNIPTHTYQQ